jgi:hypothetical protein
MHYNARTTVRYFKIYKMYLMDNNLADDSKTITVKDLHDFIHEMLDPDEIEEYIQKVEE